MGKSSGGKQQIVEYYMSVHFALCHGPVDAIWRIVVKEKEAWAGKVTQNGPFPVYQPGLFGGAKKEGGVGGAVEFFNGAPDQLMSANVASRFRRTPETMPAYRGVCTLFFSNGRPLGFFGGAPGTKSDALGLAFPMFPGAIGPVGFDLTKASYAFSDIPLDRDGGFYWSSNNPYLPETWVKASRAPKTPLPAALGSIPNLVPEAVIGLPKVEEPKEDEEPEVPDAENEDPLNGYYIGSLPTEQNFIQTKYGWRGTSQNVIDDPAFERRLFDVSNQQKLKIGGLVYRNYGDDANPAHVIMECMTNNVWGMSASESMFDMPSFLRAAQTLYDEKFGVSFAWIAQTTIEAMVSEILDHIQGTLFLSPRTGLFTLKLLRDDYDVETLRTLTPDNGSLRSFQRKAFAETVNEIVVTWTNPENEKESTVTLQDLANIAIQGGIVSDARNYYAVRNASLAMKLCARDLRSASAPLASLEADLDRSAWDVEPGEILRVVWPDEGIAGAVYRVMDVDYGRIGSGTIKVKLVEDVFALPTQGYSVLGPARPVDFDGQPSPLDHLLLMTPPPQIGNRFGDLQASAFPDSAVMILGAANNTAVESFEARSTGVATDGKLYPVSLGEKAVTSHSLFPQGLPKEFESKIVAMSAVTRAGGLPSAGGLLLIGSTQGEHEIAMFTAFSETEGYTFKRGMLDTVPRAWPPNTPAWVIQFGVFGALDPSPRPAGVPVDYSFLPRTARDVLSEDFANKATFTPTDRLWRPTRPANCRVGGQPLAFTVDAPVPATIPLTWANRNRTQEDTVFLNWTDGSVSPEPGQTTTIRVVNRTGALVAEHKGLTGTTFNLSTEGLPPGRLEVRFSSERDGLESIQAFSVALDMPLPPPHVDVALAGVLSATVRPVMPPVVSGPPVDASMAGVLSATKRPSAPARLGLVGALVARKR